MNICVVGAGAIAGWMAAKLAVSGEQVMALTSSDALVGLG
jgi:ketopantoate reductase